MSDEYLMEPYEFANETFALNNKAIFDEYIEQRVHGVSSHVAFRIAFGEEFVKDNNTTARIYSVEKNPYYKTHFKSRLQGTKVDDLWNPKIAVNHLLSVAVDKFEKGSTRLAAMKELNILANIVIIDENGKTKAGRTLADFYAQEGADADVVPVVEVAEAELPQAPGETRH